MKNVAILAALMPWILVGIFVGINIMIPAAVNPLPYVGILWLAVSPAWFGLGILIAYREGQWSKK